MRTGICEKTDENGFGSLEMWEKNVKSGKFIKKFKKRLKVFKSIFTIFEINVNLQIPLYFYLPSSLNRKLARYGVDKRQLGVCSVCVLCLISRVMCFLSV